LDVNAARIEEKTRTVFNDDALSKLQNLFIKHFEVRKHKNENYRKKWGHSNKVYFSLRRPLDYKDWVFFKYVKSWFGLLGFWTLRRKGKCNNR